MSFENYQALAVNSEGDIFAVLDLKLFKIITAAIILFIVPTNFVAFFIGNFGSSIVFLMLFLIFLKKSASTFLIYKNQTKQLIIYVLDGFVPRKKIIKANNIEKFVIDSGKNRYRIAIILKNGKAIVPVPQYTSAIYLSSLNKTINLLSQCLKLTKTSSHVDVAPNQYQEEEQIRQAKKKSHQYVQAKHWRKQAHKNAIQYIHRPSLQTVTRLSTSNKNPVLIVVVVIIIIMLCYFLIF